MFLTREAGVSSLKIFKPAERAVAGSIDVNRDRYRPPRGLNYLFGGVSLGLTPQARRPTRPSRLCFSRRLLSWTLQNLRQRLQSV